MQRGTRPARPFTHFSNSFLLFLAPPASCRLAGWLVGWLVGWLAGWLVLRLALPLKRKSLVVEKVHKRM